MRSARWGKSWPDVMAQAVWCDLVRAVKLPQTQMPRSFGSSESVTVRQMLQVGHHLTLEWIVVHASLYNTML